MNHELVKIDRHDGTKLSLSFIATELAESRFDELSVMTHEKLPEYLNCFINAISEVSRYIALLEHESAIFEYKLEKRRSSLLVEIVPQQVEAKKLRSSEDIRSALVSLDEILSELEMKKIDLDYAKNLCKARLKSLEAVYFSAQKTVDFVRDRAPVRGYASYDGLEAGMVSRR